MIPKTSVRIAVHCIIIFILTNSAFSETSWIKVISISDGHVVRSSSSQQNVDGDFIIAGTMGSSNYDIFLLKTDTTGSLIWEKNYKEPGQEEVYSVRQTFDKGYILAGKKQITGVSDPNIYLIKTDSVGDILWEKTIGGLGQEIARCVRQTNDGGYIITGYISSSGSSYTYLVKTDAMGNLSWEKTFGGSNEEGYSVEQTSDGGFIVIGRTYVENYPAILLIKTDSNGNKVWEKAFGVSVLDQSEAQASSIKQTVDNGYIIAGRKTYDRFPTPLNYSYLVKTDANGDILWEKESGYHGWNSIDLTPDGGFIAVATTSLFISLYKADSMGNEQWIEPFRDLGFVQTNQVHQLSDGGYLINGISYTNPSGVLLIYFNSSHNTIIPGIPLLLLSE